MDWLEQWFGFAPDSGDGSLELLILLTALTAGAIIALWRRVRVGWVSPRETHQHTSARR